MNASAYSDNPDSNVSQTRKARSRKISLAAGILYLITFASIPAFVLYAPVRDPNYIAGPGPDNTVIFGGILEIVVALACIGTAVALYPVVKRQNEAFALGFVGARILGAGAIFAGVVCLMTMVTLRKSGAGAEGLITGRALLAMYDWFHLGQTLMPAVNAALLGSLLYQSRLVPRILPLLGFVHRRPPACCQRYHYHVRHFRAALKPDNAGRYPDCRVGIFTGRLARRQRVLSNRNHCRV